MTGGQHHGSCHCGAVAFEVILSAGLTTARRCNCSYCSRRGTIAVTARVGDLAITKGADHVRTYQWNTKVAKHWFCPTCGISTHHQRRSNPNEFGVNAACLDGVKVWEMGQVVWTDRRNHSKDR